MPGPEAFFGKGWLRFPAEPAVADWVAHVHPLARRIAADPAARSRWLRCGGTWFVGVNALPNDEAGAVAGSGPLTGAAADFIARELGQGGPHWDRAQISVTYPGYPRPDPGESEAAHGFRLRRDAAHLDGLLAVGPARRRMLRERHAFLLGLPLSDAGPGASPLVIWEGSHEVMRAALASALAGQAPRDWADIDLTEAYQAARRRCFERCRRVVLPARPGEATLVHRLALHGVAPWRAGTVAPPEGRMVAYFRPAWRGPAAGWLDAP